MVRMVITKLRCIVTNFRLFTAGFAVLPFLWAINAVWFFRDAFRSPFFEEQPEIRKCKSSLRL